MNTRPEWRAVLEGLVFRVPDAVDMLLHAKAVERDRRGAAMTDFGGDWQKATHSYDFT